MSSLRVSVVCLFAMLAALAARAEVTTDFSGPFVNTLIMGIVVEDPDPLGAAWEPFRSIPPERILNPAGHLRGDGWPDVAQKALQPVVTWAYNAGSDHDVAFAEWTGSAWSTIEFLTAGVDDDLDPRIFAEPNGTLHIVWWTEGGVDRVLLATKPAASSDWSAPVEVLAGGRRPSVAVLDGVLRVACERDSTMPGMTRDVVVLRREAGGDFIEELSTATPRTEPLDPVLHATSDRLWLDWKHGLEVFGCVEHGPAGWEPVQYASWPDPSWVGVEGTRKVIQGLVLGH